MTIQRALDLPLEECATTVAVTREGQFLISRVDKVDEIEIFKGVENKLAMFQSYNKEFKCMLE